MERRTSNIERPMVNQDAGSAGPVVFDVQCWTFDVRRSRIPSPSLLLTHAHYDLGIFFSSKSQILARGSYEAFQSHSNRRGVHL